MPKFISLTYGYSRGTFRVRPELISHYGPSTQNPPENPPRHNAWISTNGKEIFVLETVAEIAALLGDTE